MEFAFTDHLEMHQVAEERYPHLHPDEAFLELFHDVFVKCPTKLARISLPAADIAAIVGVFRQDPRIMAVVEVIRMLAKTSTRESKAVGNSTVVMENSASNQPGIATAQSLSQAVAGQSTIGAPDNVIKEIHGIHVIGNSLVDHIKFYGRWMQTVSAIQIAQGHQVIQALNVICDHLRDTNTITVSGGAGPDGFARPVYDYIHKKINDLDQSERHRHRYFLYHPDTNWYGAFHRLIRENPLPAEFCAKSDNLDTICLFMQDVRQRLTEESSSGKDIVFHLLIPSWYSITIKQPLQFPDSLHPLRIEGEKHKGKELVEMNLPAAPTNMLDGIANALDPNKSNAIASVASVAITVPAVGWGVNGACLAIGMGVGVLTGLGPLVGIPIWVATAGPAMKTTAPAMEEAIYSALSEEEPRILGSTERLSIPRVGQMQEH